MSLVTGCNRKVMSLVPGCNRKVMRSKGYIQISVLFSHGTNKSFLVPVSYRAMVKKLQMYTDVIENRVKTD